MEKYISNDTQARRRTHGALPTTTNRLHASTGKRKKEEASHYKLLVSEQQ